ncbi:MAG: hypothetical protein EPO20_15525 [Betaproteobacteria bacterium]|nr:MAG: hypothetical protein EPO20_15525 [Betaproteobacteria bacterium]
MQKISRIYVGNYGPHAAWFDGLTFDFNDPDTDQPCDAVINLENGGGKTTLLGFIFSCFETRQERFLKHVQDRNHRFAEYFSKDGLPGFIVMEWLMPPKFSAGKPYRLVIGQTVAVRSAAEREEVDRQFFAFEATPKLGFDSVPAPHLGAGEPARSMAEFLKWIHAAVGISSDFYHTRTQEDWQKHLVARSLDLDMLRLQLDFSAQEGGIDASFLTFHNEADFLRKFFALTLDAEKAAAVRQVVVGACDTLRKKPFLERRLRELTKLSGVMKLFFDAAGHYESAREARASLNSAAAAVRAALLAKVVSDEAAMSAHAEFANAQDAVAASSAKRVQHYVAQGLTLRLLRLQRALMDTEAAREKSEADLSRAELDLRLIEGARSLVRVEEARVRVAETEALEEAQREGLKPARMQAEVQGALLRSALHIEERRLSEAARSAQARENGAENTLASLKDDLQKLSLREATLNRDQGALQSDEQRYVSRRDRLLSEGLLLRSEASSESAIARLGQALVAVREAHARALDDERRFAEAERAHHASAQAAALEADGYKREKTQQETLVAKGEAEREKLSQLPVLRMAVEADLADPDSPALLPALDKLSLSDEAGIAAANVRLAELESNRKAIEATGVAGRSRDVDEVVTTLLAAGVRSARAFNTYLADVFEDPKASRALVLADPARFLGVSVAAADFRRAKDVLQKASIRLARPVVVSELALESSDKYEVHLVVGPADDAAYNREAASIYAGRLDSDIAEATSELKAYRARRDEAFAAKQLLRSYAEAYGRARLDHARAQIERLGAEAEAANGRAAQETDAASTAAAQVQAAKVEAGKLARADADLENSLRRMREFQHEDEGPRAVRVERLAEISRELQEIEKRRAHLAIDIDQAETERKTAYEEKVRFDSAAKAHAKERSEVALYDAKYPAEQALADRPMTLEVLRQVYCDAKSTLETAERDRLGVLAEKLRSHREALETAQKEFSTKYADLELSELARRKSIDFDARIADQQKTIETAKRTHFDALAKATAAGTALQLFKEQNRQVASPSAEMEILKDSEVLLRIAQADREAERAKAKAEAAQAAAVEARSKRDRAEAAAKLATQCATMLSTALDIPDQIGETAPTTLEADIAAQVNALISKANEHTKRLEGARNKAQMAFNALARAAAVHELQEVEPELSMQLSGNEFDAACADRSRLSEGLTERIATTEGSISHMREDFESCVVELHVLSSNGMQVLTSATTGKRVPQAAPYVGGKPVLKMRANFSQIQIEVRREALRRYLDNLIETGVVPAKGADLVAECVLRMYGKSLGLQVLKMVPDEDQQYVAVDQLKNSGGEGVTMAMFLYLVINQLRAETHAKLKKAGGGPLILDNPFAKATTPTLWRAQRLLAEAMDVQLIFATALPDYNTIGEFRRFIRLRKAGKDQRTGRWHLEHADLTLADAAEQFT